MLHGQRFTKGFDPDTNAGVLTLFGRTEAFVSDMESIVK